MNRCEIERELDLGETEKDGDPEKGSYVTVTIKGVGEYEDVKRRIESITDSVEAHRVEE